MGTEQAGRGCCEPKSTTLLGWRPRGLLVYILQFSKIKPVRVWGWPVLCISPLKGPEPRYGVRSSMAFCCWSGQNGYGAVPPPFPSGSQGGFQHLTVPFLLFLSLLSSEGKTSLPETKPPHYEDLHWVLWSAAPDHGKCGNQELTCLHLQLRGSTGGFCHQIPKCTSPLAYGGALIHPPCMKGRISYSSSSGILIRQTVHWASWALI